MGDWKTNDVITAERLNAMQTAVFEINARETDNRIRLQLQASYADLEYCMEHNIPVQAICHDWPDPEGSGITAEMTFTLYLIFQNSKDQTHPYNAMFCGLVEGNFVTIPFTQSDQGKDLPMNAKLGTS